jgi:hypothetical protein
MVSTTIVGGLPTWTPCAWKEENGVKTVFSLRKVGSKTVRTPIGVLGADNKIMSPTGQILGEYRKPSATAKLFPEVVVHQYRQIAEVYRMDHEFVARWASYAWSLDNRDLKTILAAFLMVQEHAGAPVKENGAVIFHDDDYRAVGEAMFLLGGKGAMDPKLLLRVGDILSLPGVAQINRELGFGKSARNPVLGRWPMAVERWLSHRENNPKMLKGLVKAGMGELVKTLARRVHYRPESPLFFEILGWKQSQAASGHRKLALDVTFAKEETWKGLTEKQICTRILKVRPSYKRLVGSLDREVSPAIMAACMEAKIFSDKDLIILTPTLEDLGLLTKEPYASAWKAATQRAEDQRSLNIAKNVRSSAVKDVLSEASDRALQKSLAEVTRNLRVYCMVDISGSMTTALAEAKSYLSSFLQGFPLDRLHVSVFNTVGREVVIKSPTQGGVEAAFKPFAAGGGTTHSAGVRALAQHKPLPDEDVLFIWVGDSGENGDCAATIRASELNPVAFGFLPVGQVMGNTSMIPATAAQLGIPLFHVDKNMFKQDDPYATTRVLRNLIASTPVGTKAVQPRVTLVEQILKTPLLQRPIWAS